MKTQKIWAGFLALAIFLSGSRAEAASETNSADWTTEFATPGTADQPHTWWHWMNGNVTRAGITADLEAMKRAGIHSATIVTVGIAIPRGPVDFLSPEWLAMVKFAAQEAQRLGMKLGMGDDAGWSSSGGPWVTPEYSMQEVVESEKQLTGPAHFLESFPQPPTKRGFYRDLEIIAIPTPAEEQETMEAMKPTFTGSDPGFDGAQLSAGHPAKLPLATPAQPQYVQVAFDRPFQVRTIALTTGALQSTAGIEASDDGQTFHTVGQIEVRPVGGVQDFAIAPVSARFFRIAFLQSSSRQKQIVISKIELSPAVRIPDYPPKAMYEREEDHLLEAEPIPADIPADMIVQPGQTIDLTAHLDAGGRLDWQVPAGNWTVLRFGYTTTGVTNHPAPPEGTGLECDKLSRAGAKFFWDGIMPKMKQALGPLLGSTFDHILIDSYEVGCQNWTPDFREEFRKRCGYDVFPYLPTLTGRYVESPEKTERFLWDFRRTIADLFAENYDDYFEVLAHRAGIKLEVEPYGDGPFEDLQSGRSADRVMGEFWWPDGMALSSVRLAASVAHTYGKRIVGSEAFTSFHGGWEMSPPTMKALGDLAFVSGVNSYDFHRYTLQPWMNRFPGMTMGPWGSTIERTNNWWEESTAWMKYLARCNFLLQKGRVVMDCLFPDDEGAPAGPPAPKLAPGYDWDSCDQDVLLHRLTAKNGRLLLPDGMSYRILVLPDSKNMTPALLRKLQELAAGGATILGEKPAASPSLIGYPQCNAEVKKLSDELWNSGKIISGKTPEEVLDSLGVKPDFECDTALPPIYIHRVDGDTDIYFVSNQGPVDETVDCTFRVTGKTPELWHPDSGLVEKIAVYSDRDGRTRLPLRLDPAGSVFVVFRPAKNSGDHAVSVVRSGGATPAGPVDSLTIQKATYGDAAGIGTMEVTAQLNSLVKNGRLLARVSNDLFGNDPSLNQPKELKIDYTLNGKEATQTAKENTILDIASSQTAVPDYAMDFGPGGGLQLEAWHPGTYTIRTAAGRTWTKDVTDLAVPLDVAGPWALDFPPNWGAPPHASFDQLISWPAASDPGIKYFSGTATYHKTVPISPAMLGNDRHLYLDLGDVEVIAQVRLNGKDLGILWKRPYRVEITPAARAGDNALEVMVTNLWPNRRIGDDQLPEDTEWKPDGSLKEFPQWFLDGKPSPTGRFTFATWKHWNKDSPLFPSGLIGPVKLLPSVTVSLP